MKRNKVGKIFLSLSLPTVFFLSQANAAEQGILQEQNTYIIPKHKYTNEQVYNENTNTFNRLNGKNYYGIKSNGKINDITLIYNNPKTPGYTTKDLPYKLEILNPDFTDEKISPDGNNIEEGTEFTRVQKAVYIPFLVSAFSNGGDVYSNNLIIADGELSSVYFLKPTDKEVPTPARTENDDRFDYLITAGFTKKGESYDNTIEIKENGYINMGVENTYALPLNGAPYVVGGISLAGEVHNNKVIFQKDSAIDFHASKFTQINNIRKYDERIMHIIGGLSYNSDVKNNKVTFNGSKINVHGPAFAYSTLAAAHIVGGICTGKLKPCNAINNTIEINSLNLDLRVDSSGTPLAYDAIANEIFWGGRTSRGNAIGNKIIINDLQTILALNASVKVSGLVEFYGGYAIDGEANNNTIEANLQHSIKAHENFLGKNEFTLYGGYATKGASGNSINIRHNLTSEDMPENHQDRIQLVAANTKQGQANNNKINISNINTALPFYIYAVEKRMMQNQKYYADSADSNSIVLRDVKSSKALNSVIEAQTLTNNAINYNGVQSISSISSTFIASKVSIRANELSNNNLVNLKDYSSAARENIYVIRGDKEVMYNKMYLNNITLGTASDKREGIIVITAGLGEKSHDNILAITNLNIDEYHNNSQIYIAPSAHLTRTNANSSSDNTLYMGGTHNIFQGTIINNISGSFNQTVTESENTENYTSAITPSSSAFTKGNHFIVDSNVVANTINNFEHYTFILSKDIDINKAMIVSNSTALNLSSQGALNLYTKDNFNVKKGTKIKIIESKAGFTDIEGRALDINNLKSLLTTMSKNTKQFSTKMIPNLSNKKLNKLKYTLETNENGTIIYMNII
ncbi:hypothetical protein [Campylobacter sp. CCS1377]|uniref:Uncharacterized protein n=1 Tax=Campylobacter sp. CCS1377 TaxID=3158229 RepID=A0AAU7EA41_9BACT|nr:hypothetical protein [Campylobacter jejuni]